MFGFKYDSIFIAVKIFKFFTLTPGATIIDRSEVVTKRMDVAIHFAFCAMCLFFSVYNYIMPIKLAKTGSKIMDNGINIIYASGFLATLISKNMLAYYRHRICKLAIFLHRCDRMVRL
jgi:hypothetical protein